MLIGLEPGQELGEHQVKEHACLLVVDGRVRVEAGGERSTRAPATLFRFEPDERHSVRATAARGCCSCSRRGPARATTAASALGR